LGATPICENAQNLFLTNENIVIEVIEFINFEV